MVSVVRIFQPQPTEGYEWVLVDDPDDAEMLRALGPQRLGASYRPIPVTRLLAVDGEPRLRADMPWLGSHVLVLGERARAVLEPVLGADVELLPLVVDDGSELWVTHALRYEPVLDLEASDLKRFSTSDRIMRIVRHEFRPEVTAAGAAFKLDAMHRGALYVTDAIVDAAMAAGLTGAHFEQVWSSAA